MAVVSFTGSDETIALIRAELARFVTQECVPALKTCATTLVDELCQATPVWSGETVRNYAIGIGRRPTGGTKEPIGGTRGQPGTNHMALGEEERRPANEEAAKAEVKDVLSGVTTLVDLVVTNTVDEEKWDLVENGEVPTEGRARYPGGVSIIATANTKAAMGGDFQ